MEDEESRAVVRVWIQMFMYSAKSTISAEYLPPACPALCWSQGTDGRPGSSRCFPEGCQGQRGWQGTQGLT